MALSTIAVTSGLLVFSLPFILDSETQRFAEPVQLVSGEGVLGGKVRYPSPRLVDLDGDGAREMIVGDLTGTVRVARPAGGEDALAWGELAPFTTSGVALKFHNW